MSTPCGSDSMYSAPDHRLERVHKMLDPRFAFVRRDDAHHVEAAGESVTGRLILEEPGKASELPLLGGPDGAFRRRLRRGGAGAHFDEHQRVAVHGDEVDFTGGAAEIARDDLKAPAAQERSRVAFAAASEESSRIHGSGGSADQVRLA